MPQSDVVDIILSRPYVRMVVPESDGTFRGEMLEFPGCLATGDTAAEALAALEEAAKSWLMAALDARQPIPDPVDTPEFSGRVLLTMPKSLHKKAAHVAAREGVSLDQYIVLCLAEIMGN